MDNRYRFSIEKDELSIPVVPVYHPGVNRTRNRTVELEISDWKEVKKIYEEQCKILESC